jgi:hypothetical protein
MRNLRLLSGGLTLIALAAFVLFLLFGWLFYEFYLKWIYLFEDGRYFDPRTETVHHDSSFIWGILSLASLLISIVFRLAARKMRRRQIS